MGVYDNKRKVYVEPFAGSPINYGFATNVDNNVSTACGHQAVGTGDGIVVFGASSPKPGRATRRRATGENEGSFYDYAVYFQLLQDGWNASLPRRRRGGASARGQTVYVTNGGFKYAWNLTNRQINRIGGLEGLGIRIAAGENDLVFGVRSPKPPLALRTIVGEGGTDVISTFIDPANANNLPEGWKLEREYVPIDRT